jgi:hypothetical protein
MRSIGAAEKAKRYRHIASGYRLLRPAKAQRYETVAQIYDRLVEGSRSEKIDEPPIPKPFPSSQ